MFRLGGCGLRFRGHCRRGAGSEESSVVGSLLWELRQNPSRMGQQPTVIAAAGSITCGQPAGCTAERDSTTPLGASSHRSLVVWNVSPEQYKEQCQLTCNKQPSKPTQSHHPALLPPTDPPRSRPASPMKQGMEYWIVSACFIEPHGIMSITTRYCSLPPTPITPLAPSLPLAARKYCTSGRHGRTRTLVPTPGPSRADGAKEDARRTPRCGESGQLW